MYGVARGIAFLPAGGTTVPVRNNILATLGNGSLFGFPIVVLVTIIIVAVMHFVLSQSRYGQREVMKRVLGLPAVDRKRMRREAADTLKVLDSH
jgi:predicted ABC-type sugar transport system permease subunit